MQLAQPGYFFVRVVVATSVTLLFYSIKTNQRWNRFNPSVVLFGLNHRVTLLWCRHFKSLVLAKGLENIKSYLKNWTRVIPLEPYNKIGP